MINTHRFAALLTDFVAASAHSGIKRFSDRRTAWQRGHRSDLLRIYRCRVRLLLVGLGLLIASLNAMEATGQQNITVGMVSQAADGTAATLETLGTSSLESSQFIIGQQQLLLSSVIKATSARVSEGYSSNINRTIATLGGDQAQSLTSFTKFLQGLSNVKSDSEIQYAAQITKALAVAHAVLDAVPTRQKAPLLFGVAVPGVLAAGREDYGKLVFFGYHLMESTKGSRPPSVVISESNLQASVIEADFSKIVVQVPGQLMRAIGHKDSPCDPLKPFTASVAVYHKEPLVADYILINAETTLSADFHRPRLLDVTAAITAKPQVFQPTVTPFSITSTSIDVDCEQTKPATLEWNVPQNARVLASTAFWVDTNNLTVTTQASSDLQSRVVATGSLRGLNKQCALFGICNCPGGGHGRFVLEGSYTLTSPDPSTISVHSIVAESGRSTLSIPFNNSWRVSEVALSVARAGCSTELDHITLKPDAPDANLDRLSLKHLFGVRLVNNSIQVWSSGHLD